MNLLKRLILYPLGPRPISCSQAAKMGHAKRAPSSDPQHDKSGLSWAFHLTTD